MIYAITLHIDVTDENALTDYVRAHVIPEYCHHPERIGYQPIRELLYWLYDPASGGTSFPGTAIVNSSIVAAPELTLEPAAAAVAAETFTLPSFIPWA